MTTRLQQADFHEAVSGRNPVDVDSEVDLARLVMLTTKTAANSDLAEEDKEDDRFEVAVVNTTTLTSSNGDVSEGDDADDRYETLVAMTTTLTESTGDNESDQEDGDRQHLVADGQILPLAFRFAETVPAMNVRLRYDADKQMHVASNGRSIVEMIKSIS